MLPSTKKKVVVYISHQMAVNQQNKTTPVLVIFNCSQKYHGYSINSSCSQGPNRVNNFQGIILRFWNDVVAAQGDITKMFNMVRIA